MTNDDNLQWEKVRRIWEIIDRLRGEGGCPWDRKQTPESVQTYLIEEAHEASSAVRAGHTGEAAEELGDLLFMVFFMIHLYEERNDFRLDDVADLITEKMVRRHPHVFGDVTVESAQEVKDNWEKIKAREKVSSGKAPSVVPESLPALMRAYRMISRISKQDKSQWDDLPGRARDFAAKAGRLSDELAADKPVSAKEFGELFQDLVNLARLKGYRAEDSLHDSLRDLESSG